MERQKADRITCPYCAEFRLGQQVPELAAHLAGRGRVRVLGRAALFPSVSPIAAGHFLVAPVRHVQSMRAASSREAADVKLAIDEVRAGITLGSHEVLTVSEHAAGHSGSRACGIVHAHVHVLPLDINIYSHIESYLHRTLAPLGRGDTQEIMRAVNATSTYLTFGDYSQQTLFAGEDVPSQLVRRLACEQMGRSWDWKRFADWELFDRTLGMAESAA